jgi:hypothetical protein
VSAEQLTLEPRAAAPVNRLVAAVKAAGQDFEWYPTTDAIIAAVIRDVGRSDVPHGSVLDIGAGNGKVLRALRDAKLGYHRDGFRELYAIEKSQPLLQQLDPDVFVVGTEFEEQSLLSKRVDVIFCNPPFSQHDAWAEKIIREAASQVVYLVLPERWDASARIKDALRYREATAKPVGSFDFEDAERQARAKVVLLRIGLERDRHAGDGPDDAFRRRFREQFAGIFEKFGEAKGDAEDDEEQERLRRAYADKRKAKFAQLVVGPSYPEALVNIYNAELAHIERNYQLVADLDADLLREFDISPERIMKCLHARLSGLRSDYWHELFAHLSAVTDRLTSKSRKLLLETLHANVHVDFTLGNIYAVVIWVIKNANRYIDRQLVETYELMVSKANVFLYKSNQRTWRDEQWRYIRHDDEDKPERYALDYRIVTHRAGGVSESSYSFERGLQERGAEFVGDLLTIAKNLGFNTTTFDRRLGWDGRKEWTPGALEEFWFTKNGGEPELIFDVRGFKNGNVHLRLNKRFILALNVEHGRLKGWLRTPAEAAAELEPDAAQFFQANKQLLRSDVPLLTNGEGGQ